MSEPGPQPRALWQPAAWRRSAASPPPCPAAAAPALPRGRPGPHSRSPTSRILTSFFMAPLPGPAAGRPHMGLGGSGAAAAWGPPAPPPPRRGAGATAAAEGHTQRACVRLRGALRAARPPEVCGVRRDSWTGVSPPSGGLLGASLGRWRRFLPLRSRYFDVL